MDSNINYKQNVNEEGWPIEGKFEGNLMIGFILCLGESFAEMNSEHLDRLVDGTEHLAFSRLESSQIAHLIRASLLFIT